MAKPVSSTVLPLAVYLSLSGPRFDDTDNTVGWIRLQVTQELLATIERVRRQLPELGFSKAFVPISDKLELAYRNGPVERLKKAELLIGADFIAVQARAAGLIQSDIIAARVDLEDLKKTLAAKEGFILQDKFGFLRALRKADAAFFCELDAQEMFEDLKAQGHLKRS